MALGPLGQIHISVTDVERSVSFYRDVLGMELVGDEVTEEATRLVYFRVGESSIQLLAPLSEDNPLHQWLADFGEGIHHVCLAADDLADAVRLSAEPSKVTIAPTRFA